LSLPPPLQHFRSLSRNRKLEYLAAAPPKVGITLAYTPDLWLRDEQIISGTEWRYCLVLAGRGWGKTKAGACWIQKAIYAGEKSVALVAPSYQDLVRDMVPALIAEFPPSQRPTFNEKKNLLTFHTGAKGYCYSSDTEIRGQNVTKIWCEELCKWCDSIPEKVSECFNTAEHLARLGKAQILITTTPKPWKILRDFEDAASLPNANTVLVRGKTTDNRANLSAAYLKPILSKYAGTRLGRQELEGEILRDNPGALWTDRMIADARSTEPLATTTIDTYQGGKLVPKEVPALARIVIAVDPAVTSNKKSDETGIIVAGIDALGEAYVIEDASGVLTPHQWATKVNDLFYKYMADRIICERNNGGDLVEINLRTVNKSLPITTVHATRGKIIRAEPIAALYEQGKVHHLQRFDQLEDQMTSFSPETASSSPDRLDALVYALTELVLSRRTPHYDLSNLPNAL
jgi:phage terminase large subunit-like protein